MKFGKEKFSAKDGFLPDGRYDASNGNKFEALPEKEKRLIKEIEKMPMDVLEKIDLLLVWRGFRPWTKLTYIYKKWNAGDPEPNLTPERKRIRASEFNQLLESMGLAAVASEEYRNEPSFEKEKDIPGKEYRNYYISSKIEIAKEMAEKSEEREELELTEEIKNKIQKLSPALYTEMIRVLKAK